MLLTCATMAITSFSLLTADPTPCKFVMKRNSSVVNSKKMLYWKRYQTYHILVKCKYHSSCACGYCHWSSDSTQSWRTHDWNLYCPWNWICRGQSWTCLFIKRLRWMRGSNRILLITNCIFLFSFQSSNKYRCLCIFLPFQWGRAHQASRDWNTFHPPFV